MWDMGDNGSQVHGHSSGDAMQIEPELQNASSREFEGTEHTRAVLSRKSTEISVVKREGAADGDVPEPARKRSRKHSPEEVRSASEMQRYRTHKLAADGEKFGMTSASAKAIPFAELSTRLRDTALIKVMKLILHRVCVLTADGVRSCPGAEVPFRPARPQLQPPSSRATHTLFANKSCIRVIASSGPGVSQRNPRLKPAQQPCIALHVSLRSRTPPLQPGAESPHNQRTRTPHPPRRPEQETKNVNVRVFLASFMIAYRASNVFESINKLETDLQAASVNMLEVHPTLCIFSPASWTLDRDSPPPET